MADREYQWIQRLGIRYSTGATLQKLVADWRPEAAIERVAKTKRRLYWYLYRVEW